MNTLGQIFITLYISNTKNIHIVFEGVSMKIEFAIKLLMFIEISEIIDQSINLITLNGIFFEGLISISIALISGLPKF